MSRRGRWLLAVLTLALLLALAALTLVGRVLEPERLTPLLLGQASQVLGLELRVSEPVEYALRPEPRLVLRGLEAHLPGTAEPLARFDRMELSLPWDTLRGRAQAVHRIDVDGATVDIPATHAWLGDWLDARPPGDGPARPISLTRGVGVRDSQLLAGDWRIDGLDLELDRFEQGRISAVDASGTAHAFQRSLPFSLAAQASLSTDEAEPVITVPRLVLVVRDGVDADAPRYALDADHTVARLGADGWQAEAASLGVDAMPGAPGLALKLQIDSPVLDGVGATVRLGPAGFDLHGGDLVPATVGQLQAQLDAGQLSFDLGGIVEQWPPGWPALPEPLGSDPQPLAVELRYRGSPGLDDPIEATVQRDGASAAARFELWPLLAWRLSDAGSPLPPIQGRIQAREILLDGVRLQGVRVMLGEDAAAPGDNE